MALLQTCSYWANFFSWGEVTVDRPRCTAEEDVQLISPRFGVEFVPMTSLGEDLFLFFDICGVDWLTGPGWDDDTSFVIGLDGE